MPSILLVEDSATQAMQMKMLLESAHHTVDCCDDGAIADQRLANGAYELVVTDMELPTMNGLELVKKMRIDYPEVPAVLVTGHGSERLAAEALRCGASAYVPKILLNEMLLSTIEDVLGVLRTDRDYARLIDCTVENRLVFELENDPRLASNAVNLVMQMANGMRLFSGAESYRVGNALNHAVSNALFRGNLELTFQQWRQKAHDELNSDTVSEIVAERLAQSPYKDRKIHFDARLMKDMMRVVIRDEGRGFLAQEYLSKEPKDLSSVAGRGLNLIKSSMDKVSFNGVGNEITMIKHCDHATHGH